MSKELREKQATVPHFPVRLSHGLPCVENRISKVRSLSSVVTIFTACFIIQLSINLPHYTHNFNGQNLFTVVYVFSARTSACVRRTILFRNQARRCRSGTPYSSRQTLCWDCQIAFHYTCEKLSGPGLSTKWLLKHNSLSVPFPVGIVSAMLLYQYAV